MAGVPHSLRLGSVKAENPAVTVTHIIYKSALAGRIRLNLKQADVGIGEDQPGFETEFVDIKVST